MSVVRTACKIMSDEYAKETGITTPSGSATPKEKDDWLLSETNKCIDGSGNVTDNKPPCSSSETRLTEQSGYLAYLNERGNKCIGRITGQHYPPHQPPGDTHPYPQSECNAECRNYRSNKKECVACIQKILDKNPERCPSVAKNIDVLEKSLTCMDCIADTLEASSKRNSKESLYILGESENLPQNQIKEVFACATGNNTGLTDRTSLSTTMIIIISLSVIFGVLLLIGIYFWYKKQKKTSNRDNQANGSGDFY